MENFEKQAKIIHNAGVGLDTGVLSAKHGGMSKPVPEPLKGRLFTVREGLEHGLSRKVLRHPRFESPFRGARLDRDSTLRGSSELGERARIFSFLLRQGEAFSHETALQLLGCPIRAPLDQPLHVTVPTPGHPRRAVGVCGHKSNTAFAIWERPDGVKVVPPLLALVQVSPTLSLKELVVAIDSLVLPRRGRGPLLDFASLEARLASESARGIRNLRRALMFARVGAESRMETLLRLALEAFGLAEHFELQVELSDEAGWIGRFDLVCKRCRLVLEYDGEQHRTDQAQYLKDLRRLDRVREAGYKVIRVHAAELLSGPAQVAQRVATALGVEFVSEQRIPELLH